MRSAQVAGQWRGDTALTLPLFWRRSTVSPVFFGRFPRSSLSLSRPLPTLSPSLIGHLASVDVKQHESKKETQPGNINDVINKPACVEKKCQIRHEPTFLRSSSVKREPTWPRSEELQFEQPPPSPSSQLPPPPPKKKKGKKKKTKPIQKKTRKKKDLLHKMIQTDQLSWMTLALLLPLSLIIQLSSLTFFLFSLIILYHYHLFHHYCSSQCCYYCFMCSLLACRLAVIVLKNVHMALSLSLLPSLSLSRSLPPSPSLLLPCSQAEVLYGFNVPSPAYGDAFSGLID